MCLSSILLQGRCSVLDVSSTAKESPGGGYVSILYPIAGQVQCRGRVLYCQGEAGSRLCVYSLSYCKAGAVYWTCPLQPRRGQEEVMCLSSILLQGKCSVLAVSSAAKERPGGGYVSILYPIAGQV